MYDIGIDVATPPRDPAPGDKLNPFNGSLRVRGQTIVAKVVSNRMQSTVVVERQRNFYVDKFERYEKRTSRYSAHLPSNLDVDLGDEVLIAECRPISKTVHFVVVENRTQGGKAVKAKEIKPTKKSAKKATKKAAKAATKTAKPASKTSKEDA